MKHAWGLVTDDGWPHYKCIRCSGMVLVGSDDYGLPAEPGPKMMKMWKVLDDCNDQILNDVLHS